MLNSLPPVLGDMNSFVKMSEHFISNITGLESEQNYTLVSFNAESLFTSVPVHEALSVARKFLEVDEKLGNRWSLGVDAIKELLGLRRISKSVTRFTNKQK
jgi:hypothetical protein